MSDKWWDMSDDEMDDLFREASDKVEIPFDQSSLDKLRQKIDPKPLIQPSSRLKYSSLLLLLLMWTVGGGLVYYSSKVKGSENSSFNANKEKELPVNKGLLKTIRSKEKKTKISSELVLGKGKASLVSKNVVIENKEKISKEKASFESIIKKQQDFFVKNPHHSERKGKNTLLQKSQYSNEVNRPFQDKLTRSKTLENRYSEDKILSSNDLLRQNEVSVGNLGNTNLSPLTHKEIKVLDTNFNVLLPVFENAQNEEPVKPLVGKAKYSRFGVRLGLAPDANAVEKLSGFALGKSLGVLFEYNITKRIIVQTGAIYSFKKYNTGIENYHAWAKNWTTRPILPTSVEGDCNILDIPLNIRYNVFQKPTDTWFVSGGVSSYLMLTEGYEYYYDTASIPSGFPQYVSWKRDNDYFMSTLNLSFGFEKRINKHLSIQAEPYLKAPLKEVGRGKVNLYSSGILFSLKYGF